MTSRMAVWGGAECTVNRVGDSYIDQIELSGHAHRASDYDLIASLGVDAVRFPVLWERVAPSGLNDARWEWCDANLERLRVNGITPVLGLVHHGSGPRDTSLLDPDFARKLAVYAHAVATRYPWLEYVTPINEPLTTARFSGLYGVWYPHHRDECSMARMLFNECRAVKSAMLAIRSINPSARLVQTEDLGHTHSTEALSYQADFENERRWLTYDFLCGRVVRGHPLYDYMLHCKISERELAELAADPCPPDILGIDHYVTSERYLDEDLDSYPPHTHGGNGRHAYVDVEVARARPSLRRGIESLLCETWERYGIPIVVTEAHLSCFNQCEQVRWLAEIWNGANAARDNGCDIRGVGSWALFGEHGWDELVTRDHGRYQPGAFDVSDGTPRETLVAEMVRSLARTGSYQHAALDEPGWWQACSLATWDLQPSLQ